MANPSNYSDDPRRQPTAADPFNPLPLGPDPLTPEPRYDDADPRVVNNRVDVQSERRTGASVLVAALVVVLAMVAYFAFSSNPGTDSGTTATIPPAVETVPPPASGAPGAGPGDLPAETAPAPSGEGGLAPEGEAPANPAPVAPAPAEPAPAE